MQLLRRTVNSAHRSIHYVPSPCGHRYLRISNRSSFPPPIKSRAGSSGNPDTPRQYWIPACAGMTVGCCGAYRIIGLMNCVDTYALREKDRMRAVLPGFSPHPSPFPVYTPGGEKVKTMRTICRPGQQVVFVIPSAGSV